MQQQPDDNYHLLQALIAAQEKGEAVVLATITQARGSVPRHSGAKMLVYDDGRLLGTIGGGQMEALVIREGMAALQDGQPRILPYSLVEPGRGDPGVCGGELEIYVEPYLPPATVLVIGCGHVGRSVAHLAQWLGFRVVVNDDRAELVTPELIPGADQYLPGAIDDLLQAFNVTRNTFVVAVTRNVLVDREILPKLLATPAPYIGVIGSRRRWAATKKHLQADGLSQEAISRFHSPIGLELNAETPNEIAVSIMAEIIMRRRGGTGVPMAHPEQPEKAG
jgi:xanthine dehydrogenase accessory factor